MTIREAAESLRRRQVSSEELAAAAIARIERLNPALNAFITVTAEEALRRARQADSELAAGRDLGPLHGIPIAYKDLFATRGVRTTSGSKIYENHVPTADAAVVERLEAAGAVPLGKLNMHELAYGVTSDNPHFGAVRNPWDAARSPGGSSGGSGAAVASNMVYAAMGTDTGGSIRIPASFCGVVGLKPTYGRVSRHGVTPLAWSLDHVGPLARSARDAAIALNAIAGYDRRDPACSRWPLVDFVPDEGCSIRGLRIGFPENFYFERLEPAVDSSVRGAMARAASLGAAVKPVRVPDVAALNAASRVIIWAEAAAVMTPHLERRDLFGADVLALLDQGRLVPATSYINAQRFRRAMRSEFAKLWAEIDCLIVPTAPITAPRIGETTVRIDGAEEDIRLAASRLTRGINALGLPALSMPCGLSPGGLPIGLQIVGPAFDEALILRVGAALEDSGVGIPHCPA
ncbi:MAG: amidase [Bryobacteraceae bacterium]